MYYSLRFSNKICALHKLKFDATTNNNKKEVLLHLGLLFSDPIFYK